MAQKHLKELLKEDQEPFHLKDYIADRQFYLKKQPLKTQIQLKKPKPISKNTSFLCKNACFFSLQDSPVSNKSPLFAFSKSPSKVFLHVPAKTSSLLLEAAIRIKKQTKPKTQIKLSGFSLFGSVLKRLTHRNRTQKLKSNETGSRKTEENRGDNKVVNIAISTSFSFSSCSFNGRQSSLDLESSSSGRSSNGDNDDDEFVFSNVLKKCDENFGVCLTSLNPLIKSLVNSPLHHKFEETLKHEQQISGNFQVEEEDEEDKEQNSPVSVLDPRFEDDYDVREDDGYDVECSYTYLQRAKEHLLHKLQMFERLAELDSIKLIHKDYESFTFEEKRQNDTLIDDIVTKSGFLGIKTLGFKKLVSDLIIEENAIKVSFMEREENIIKMVCKRLESWKEVEANTIDMMVEMDLKRENGEWKKPQEQIGEIGKDVEVAIFAILVNELVEDVVHFA